MRKEEEKLRKEKEKEEKKIKKEEEKLRKEKEKEEKKKAKREQKDRDSTAASASVAVVTDESVGPPAVVVPAEAAAPADPSTTAEGKEKEKASKDDKEKSKKEKSKVQKQPKQKKLSTGNTFEDFILKVYGSREFLLPGDAAALNKLIDYDYICKCINNGSPIDLIYTDKSSVAANNAQGADKDENTIDSSIARDSADSEVSEVVLSIEGGHAETSSPFWAFDADINQFSIRALDCFNLQVEPEHLKPGKASVYLAAGVYYGGRLVAPLRLTSPVAASACPVWGEEMTFDIPMRSVPREARLSISVFLRTDMNKANRSRVLRSDQPLGWINVQIFNHIGEIRDGQAAFKLWIGQAANPIGTCMENISSDNPPVLYIDMYTNKSNTPNATIKSMPKAMSVGVPAGSSFTFRKTLAGIVLGASGPRTKDREPSSEEIEELKDIMRRDSLTPLSDGEKELLWSNLAWCKKHPSILPKLLWAVDWTDRSTVSHLHRLLESWPLLHPMDALQLLDFKFPDRIVRNFAVRCLELMNNNDLYRILLQLTQALKFEPYHDSALAHFLIKRAFLDQTRVGHFFFWQLKSELTAPAVSERFSLLLESYLKSCGRATREQLQFQNDVLGKLNRIAVDIKAMRRGLGGASLDDRRAKLQAMLKETQWPRNFLLPLDPRIECSGFIVDKCRVLGSKTLPLWLAFENAETGEPIYAIYKVGDDLRQDQLTLQMIALMDDLWKREGIDLKLKPYACMAIGDDNGLIEVVKNANTTSNINIELGGVRAVYSDATLVKWLKKHNPSDKLYAKAVETFLLSCAGYSVITFALGFADRHNDNIMLTKQGNLFHIDFGHFLGHYRKLFGVTYVDKAELVFIPQYFAVIGKDNFARFERTCTHAYNVIRKHATYFITLFSLMLSSGLPEVQSVDDIRFMQERLRLDLSETDAADYFKQILQDARANSTIKLNHAFHVLYQGMRS
jgi:phosphatidylinositol-4,5-bisphosphate 3-kinase catalytic subunit alpha/beta/delta